MDCYIFSCKDEGDEGEDGPDAAKGNRVVHHASHVRQTTVAVTKGTAGNMATKLKRHHGQLRNRR